MTNGSHDKGGKRETKKDVGVPPDSHKNCTIDDSVYRASDMVKHASPIDKRPKPAVK